MDERLLAALGLPKEATLEQVLSALNAMRVKLSDTETQLQTALQSQQTPDPAQFVPMAQYNVAIQRATTAESALETARNQQTTPDASEYVPMAQYNSVLERATTAETALSDQQKAEQEKAINQAVDAAIEAGKIAPATRDFYVASCQQDGGLERFNAFVEAAPKVIDEDKTLDNKPAPDTAANHSSLDETERAMCERMGLSEEDYLKSKQEVETAAN